MSTLTIGRATGRAAIRIEAQQEWRIAGIALLSTRFIQGFIYWGGGSRRFIYAPSKLDPSAHSWMANKLQTAMPGALFGTDHVISFLLHHFDLLYGAILLFSAVELVVGAMLMAGLLTRLAAFVSMGLSVSLMAMFGWQGATCIDEWTMAAANLAMGTSLLLAGSGAYSLDNLILGRHPALTQHAWFRWSAGSLPLPLTGDGFRNLALVLFAFVAAFNVGTYDYYRGSVVTPFHGGPVSPAKHHLSLSRAAILPDGGVRVHVYLDGGTPAAPAYVVAADLLNARKQPIAHWSAADLSRLPQAAFGNDYAYNKFAPGPFGIEAKMGAAANLTLPAPRSGTSLGATSIHLTDVGGSVFSAPLGR
jgi:thiosulfate dehydrogenase (quinone)